MKGVGGETAWAMQKLQTNQKDDPFFAANLAGEKQTNWDLLVEIPNGGFVGERSERFAGDQSLYPKDTRRSIIKIDGVSWP